MTKKKKILLIIIAAVVLIALCIVGVILINKAKETRRNEEFMAAMREYYENKVAFFAEENKLYSPGEVDVAFIGDSLTDGYDIVKYYPEYKVLNRGIGGDTTYGLLARLDVSVYELKPKVIVMLIGANNLKNMFEDYENLITGIKQNLPQTQLIICSLTSMGR